MVEKRDESIQEKVQRKYDILTAGGRLNEQ